MNALMPNLIHSLDAYYMTELFYQFSNHYENCQFYSIHDCFGTTFDKVDSLKMYLSFIYINLYSNGTYLLKFDTDMINFIKSNSHYTLSGRTIILPNGDYELLSID